MLTRLAISTVGYIDENFYAACVWDFDHSLRLCLLGFQERNVLYGGFVHRGSSSIRFSNKMESPDALWYRRVNSSSADDAYAMMKWNRSRACCGGCKEPHNGMIPPDVWVRDEARIQRIRACGHDEKQRVPKVECDRNPLQP
ncbi:beta galactofuranosyl glycosyltransferase, putative, partial [Trypanosoma cruzi marinkellei]